jgi:hypothetical protein
LRFNSADSAYLNRTPASAGNRKTWTYSAWVKLSNLASSRVTLLEQYLGNSDTAFLLVSIAPDAQSNNLIIEGYNTVFRRTTASYRDFSAWYHIVVAVDTTQATANNRIRLYINNVEVTAFGTLNNPTQNDDTGINSTGAGYIGREVLGSAYSNAYMTEINLIDGSQLTPSSFGETNAQTGVWQPKAYSGSYGTNGFYLNFSDNSNTTAATLGKDYSGNGNNWTPNNFSVTAGAGNDSLVDSPTSYGTDTGVGGTVRGNYCTLNPLAVKIASAVTLSNGNLDAATVTSGDICYATMGMSSGKWYWEITCISGAQMLGISKDVFPITDWQTTNGLAYYSANGNKYTNSSGSAYGASFTTNDVIGLALDMDAGTLVFYKNGTSQGTAFTGITGTYFASVQNAGANGTSSYNFGQRPFAYTAPSGFKALCTQNLPTPTIGATTATQAGKYFNPVLWTGTGANPRTITGVGFQPDWVWGKTRSTVNNNLLFDVVRGVSSTSALGLLTDTTGAEANYYTLNGGVTAFTSDGFTVSGGSTNNNLNSNGVTYVAWNWKANGSGSTNTAGSITSTVSANTTSGFSVVTWTGTGANASVGHGLNVIPSMIIVKSRSSALDWPVGHVGLTNQNYYLTLNTTNAQTGDATVFRGWGSTNFSPGTNSLINANGGTYVAYCFAAVAGFSAFGSYTGNGSTDGPFLFTGFRPAYVMIKCSSNAATTWIVGDGTRNPSNVADLALFPNLSNAEGSGALFDLTANGIKLRTTSSDLNSNGYTYIFMAFASAPLKYSLAR